MWLSLTISRRIAQQQSPDWSKKSLIMHHILTICEFEKWPTHIALSGVKGQHHRDNNNNRNSVDLGGGIWPMVVVKEEEEEGEKEEVKGEEEGEKPPLLLL